MSDDFNYPAAVPPPPGAPDPIPPLIPSSSPPPQRQRRDSNPLLNWALAAVIVLILAVAGGLITAWLVANSRAVPEPVAFATAKPTSPPASFCACATPSGGPSAEPTEGPRFTPSPPATPEITPEPFTHIVQAGESLTYIAGIYQVAVQDIMDLNDIKNPNRIFVGQKLLIPGYGVHPTEKPTKPPK